MSKSSFSHHTLDRVRLINIPTVHDRRGNLAYIQESDTGFPVRRVYYLFDIPSGARRGGHAHRQQQELLVAVSGSFDVILHDGQRQARYTLNRPQTGLWIPNGIWRELENFSSGAVCLVVNDGIFDEADYVRDFDLFLELKR